MSKESWAGMDCACGMRIAFMEQHWPHCPANPKNLDAPTRRHMSTKFTRSELAEIATRGPMADQRIQPKRGRKHAKAKK